MLHNPLIPSESKNELSLNPDRSTRFKNAMFQISPFLHFCRKNGNLTVGGRHSGLGEMCLGFEGGNPETREICLYSEGSYSDSGKSCLGSEAYKSDLGMVCPESGAGVSIT